MNGDTATFSDGTPTVFVPLTRVSHSPGSIAGGWLLGAAAQPNSSAALIFLGGTAGNRYFLAQDFDEDGSEQGTYTWDAQTGTLTFTPVNGPSDPGHVAILSRDSLALTFFDVSDNSTFHLTRIVNPALVQPTFTGTLTAQGTTGYPFVFAPATNYASTFQASHLPPGLSIDGTTGQISGVPTSPGSYGVLLVAGNSFGLSANAVLTIAISAPAVVVVPPGENVTVEPEVPADTPPLTLTFDQVGHEGIEVTVAMIDPDTAPEPAPEPPTNFKVVVTESGVPLYYDISTPTGSAGPTTICFSFAVADLDGETPHLFHYVNGEWVDITTSVMTSPNGLTITLCGTATSFSPFAVFTTPAPFVSVAGFYAPVSPLAGFVNTVKAGSTVPLKFNIYLNGVEKTDVNGLIFSQQSSTCVLTLEDPVDLTTTGNTALTYDTTARQFVQRWKTPSGRGQCYVVTVSLDGTALLTASFKLK